MNIENTKNLVDLFFSKLKEINDSKILLQWLKPGYNHQYNWKEVSDKIFKLSNKIKKLEFKNSLLSDKLDLDYVETLIREKFLFGKEGETLYIIKKNDN